MDNRYDFISLYNAKRVFFGDISTEKTLLSKIHNIKFCTLINGPLELKNLNNGTSLLFFKSRFGNKFNFLLRNRKTNEFVIIPSFNNPRWIIKNRKEIIGNHGLIIKPTTFKSKLVWFIAKVFNFLNLFNIIFSNRFIAINTSLEEKIYPECKDEKSISIIYTGAPGKFQKFTFQVVNRNMEQIEFVKLGTRKETVERIKKEEQALKYLNNLKFNSFIIPSLERSVNLNNFYGIIQKNILSKEDQMSLKLHSQDFKLLEELINNSPKKRISIIEYFDKYSRDKIPECNQIIKALGNLKISLIISHGDYIPWNRFIGSSNIKLFDWEMFGSRPVFHDLFSFITHTALLSSNSKNYDLINSCCQEAKNLNISPSFVIIDNLNLKQSILVYLLMFTVELKNHYLINELNDDSTMVLEINKIIAITIEIVNEKVLNANYIKNIIL